KPYHEEHTLYITPKELNIYTSIIPEERHYGIYKAILYKSDIQFKGNFSSILFYSLKISHYFLEAYSYL
ncbi:MAG: inner membrane CreD family protein, partial [Bacteroidales bacterium]